MSWLFKNKILRTAPEGEFGFIYIIRNLLDGRIYVGKKQFLHKSKTKVGKRVIKATKTRQRVIVGTKDSGWLDYWGSSKSLQEDIAKLGLENFSREILVFAKNKTELSYLEVVWQIKEKVLEVPSYNGWISCKIYKNKL